jgi:membrane-associated phospholipid phosphatase
MMIATDVMGDLPRPQILKLDFKLSYSVYKTGCKHVPSWLLLALEHSGNGFIWVFGALLVMVAPKISSGIRVLALNLEVGFLLDLLIIGAVKLLVKRARPSYAEKEYHPTMLADKYSFPSGHSSRCIFIAMAFVVFRAVLHSALVVFMVIWAFGTSMSRVLLGRHYVGDVIAGALIGVLVASLLSKVCSGLFTDAFKS